MESPKQETQKSISPPPSPNMNGSDNEVQDIIAQNRARLAQKMSAVNKKKAAPK